MQRAGAEPIPRHVCVAMDFVAQCNLASAPFVVRRDDDWEVVYPELHYAQEKTLRIACHALARYFSQRTPEATAQRQCGGDCRVQVDGGPQGDAKQ
jgi:hypothetical protein